MAPETSISSDRQRQAPPRNDHRRANWGAVLALSFGAFTLVASEFLPVSLLTPMSADLQVSEGAVGQGIAISGLFAVLTSLSVSSLAGNLNRKTLLIGLAALMGISGALISLAPGYLPFMIGRALIGVVIGGFWSMSAATTIRLVPLTLVPRALAIVNGGNALATVLAAPLGSYLGSLIGWRGAFFCLVPVSIVCLVWLRLSLPSMKVPCRSARVGGLFTIFGALKSGPVAWGMAACGVFFVGQFILFTYLRPFLETVTQLDITGISVVLLVLGVSGFAGTLLIGRFLGRRLYPTLIIIPASMALVATGLVGFGRSFAATVILLAFWGLLGTSAAAGWWSWVAAAMPHNAEHGGGLMVAVIQTSIALGSTVGGLLFDSLGYQSAFLVSALSLLVAALLVAITARVTRLAAT
ncbi:MFS transporter [bacterium RCC_150]